MQGVQHRRGVRTERGEHRQPERLLVVVHQDDVVAAAQLPHHPVQVGGGDPAHAVVGLLQVGELAVGEHGDPLVDRQRAGADRGEHHPHAASTQLGHERVEHVLDPAVPGRWHGEPGPGVHEHGHGHGWIGARFRTG